MLWKLNGILTDANDIKYILGIGKGNGCVINFYAGRLCANR